MIQEYTDLLLSFISENKFWAPPIIGIMAFFESIFLIGLIMPATVILVATGALIGAGALDLLPIDITASIGCFQGDNVSYYVGSKVRPGLFRSGIYKKHRNIIYARIFYFKNTVFTLCLWGAFRRYARLYHCSRCS